MLFEINKYMSKIGKKILKLVDNVDISIDKENNKIRISGKYGCLTKQFLKIVDFEIQNNELSVKLLNSTKFGKSYHGLVRSLLQNMIIGVSKKFSKSLIAEGIGFKFQLEQNFLILNIGFTHSIRLEIPKDLSIILLLPTKVQISGRNKEQVGLYASQIRSLRPPEPYKGKGILYEDEIIRRKVGKTGR